ncbi:hypothetical protein BDZ45DRAFT_490107 [Acephala macrosclerotiorum]|nr:hypothetical protein BDZ45DRAFT_490107 [Acephala macrosclerotiorum]
MGLLTSYREWLQVADTALPQNLCGYLLQLCLSPLRSKPFAIDSYDDPKEIAKCGKHIGKRNFLPKLPEREGERPEMLKWMAPHRQATQRTDDDMHQLLAQAIDELVAKHAVHVVVRTSVLEKSGDAILIKDDIETPHAIAKQNKREIAHVHTDGGHGDHSLHLCLSPSDCKEVIEKKWGERMTLAGSLVPTNYLLIYTPRTKGEVEIVKMIIEGAIVFMTGARELAQ